MTRVQLLLATAMAGLAASFLTLALVSSRLTTEWTMRYAIVAFALTVANLFFEVHDNRRRGSRG